jgi:hypothetical protein
MPSHPVAIKLIEECGAMWGTFGGTICEFIWQTFSDFSLTAILRVEGRLVFTRSGLIFQSF